MACLFSHKWVGCKCLKCGNLRDEQHIWNLCKGECYVCGKKCDIQHDWSGCKCSKCGATRDEQHDWDGCKCSICGMTRDEQHSWDGSKCSRCGICRDELHVWDLCKGICTICGKKCNEQHDWSGCKCTRCGKVRDEHHIWKVLSDRKGHGQYCSVCYKEIISCHDYKTVSEFIYGGGYSVSEVRTCRRCQTCGYETDVSFENCFPGDKLYPKDKL